MSETSRRGLIAMTGAGAAAGAITLTSGRASAATPSPKRAAEPVTVHIEDPKSDRVRLHVGEREIVLHDRDLVVRILNAAGGR
ncbi:twin-arginine translocation signal domain-containing protein [Nocardioides sp. TRM66260-LWL]|uniref:twin-arginine translocation signal domain-containing protein n=1 Tax=Nocardioides sp. TRM66260-LWL TaxID=2874478 RepID=UPI001CC78282|nr:twin-arginine translocation signal domain-containing protein [Nocardioides sp. TRM66260-LWL]MBZ5736452.1 twin-arginine translocation signal domain-containing protein [Nocardioides sp. TRM66260-LWL]